MKRILGFLLAGALLIAAPAQAFNWRVADYVFNPVMHDAGYRMARQIIIGDPINGIVKDRWHVYNNSWSWVEGTGLVYNSPEDLHTGTLCTNGVPYGTDPDYGRAGSGHDWFSSTTSGVYYLGSTFFYQHETPYDSGPWAGITFQACDYVIASQDDPYSGGAVQYVRTVNDSNPSASNRNSILSAGTEVAYRADGSVIRTVHYPGFTPDDIRWWEYAYDPITDTISVSIYPCWFAPAGQRHALCQNPTYKGQVNPSSGAFIFQVMLSKGYYLPDFLPLNAFDTKGEVASQLRFEDCPSVQNGICVYSNPLPVTWLDGAVNNCSPSSLCGWKYEPAPEF